VLLFRSASRCKLEDTTIEGGEHAPYHAICYRIGQTVEIPIRHRSLSPWLMCGARHERGMIRAVHVQGLGVTGDPAGRDTSRPSSCAWVQAIPAIHALAKPGNAGQELLHMVCAPAFISLSCGNLRSR
jgi:hypothetical protein